MAAGMAPGVYRGVLISLVAAGAGATGLAAFALALALATDRAGPGTLALIAAILALAVTGLWTAAQRLRTHVDQLERLRGDLLVAAAHDEPLPLRWQGPAADEAGRLGQTLAQVIEQHRLRRADPDARLAAVVAAAAEGLVVVTESGLVSLVNAAAMAWLGKDHLVVGTSIYDVFHRGELAEAASRARAAGQPVAATFTTIEGEAVDVRIADLGATGGVVISLPRADAEHPVGIHHDLGLHEQPPPLAPVTEATALDALPVVVLDTETTGLDVASDRIVSIGAVRLQGPRILRHLTLDRLVNPEQAIPARSTAVHGISTAMVAGAPRFAEVLPAVLEFLSGSVVVGHCIGFDLKMLEREAARAGIAWAPPPSLCTMRLAGGLFSEADELSLDGLAERLGVTVRGRHTALGDALVTAEVYARLLPLLADAGAARFGDALALAARPKKIIAQQRASGW
jgi:DNA polymerase-3 subunit epsilon